MSWKAYPLIFRLKSPLHIGWRKVGNLHQTRPYVPGKVIWAALTVRCARAGFNELVAMPGANTYEKAGNWLKKNFGFSYLFPSLKPDLNGALYPRFEKERLIYGSYQLSEHEFQYLLLDSYASTALDYARFAAEDGSLHETEFIRPRTRRLRGTSISKLIDNKLEYEEIGAPVYLVGYVFAKNNLINEIKSLLQHVRFGAERRYGWGRVELFGDLNEINDNAMLFGQWLVDKNSEEAIQIRAEQGSFLPAHAIASSNQAKRLPVDGQLAGQVETLVGRETTQEQYFGRELSKPLICWQAGSVLLAQLSARIGDYGILEKA
jgi:hypothetical protein